MKKRLPPSIIGNFILALSSIIIFLIILEFGLRLAGFPDRIMEWDVDTTTGYSYMAPNQSYLEKWYDQVKPFPVHINSQGIRDNELRSDRGLTILAIGDSFTFGIGVKAEETYAEVLEQTLRYRFPDLHTEVINAGHGGATIDFESEYLYTRGVHFKPDIVILQFYRNDVEDYYLSQEYKKAYQQIPIPFKKALRRTALYNALMKMKLYVLAKRIGKKNRDLQSISDASEEFYDDRSGEHFAPMWEKYLSRLTETAVFCKKRGISLVLVVIPDEFQVIHANLAPKPQVILKDFARKNGVFFVDPLETLRTYYRSGKQAYIEGDSHLNAAGQRIVADQIFTALEQNKLLVPRKAVRTH